MFYYDWHLPWSVAKQSMTSRLSQSAFWSSAVTSGGLTPYLLPPILSASSSVKNKWCGDTSHVTWIPFSLAARITRTYSTNACTISKNKQDYTRGTSRTCLTALCLRLKTRTTATMPEKCVHSLKVKNWLHLEISEQNMKMDKFHWRKPLVHFHSGLCLQAEKSANRRMKMSTSRETAEKQETRETSRQLGMKEQASRLPGFQAFRQTDRQRQCCLPEAGRQTGR